MVKGFSFTDLLTNPEFIISALVLPIITIYVGRLWLRLEKKYIKRKRTNYFKESRKKIRMFKFFDNVQHGYSSYQTLTTKLYVFICMSVLMLGMTLIYSFVIDLKAEELNKVSSALAGIGAATLVLYMIAIYKHGKRSELERLYIKRKKDKFFRSKDSKRLPHK